MESLRVTTWNNDLSEGSELYVHSTLFIFYKIYRVLQYFSNLALFIVWILRLAFAEPLFSSITSHLVLIILHMEWFCFPPYPGDSVLLSRGVYPACTGKEVPSCSKLHSHWLVSWMAWRCIGVCQCTVPRGDWRNRGGHELTAAAFLAVPTQWGESRYWLIVASKITLYWLERSRTRLLLELFSPCKVQLCWDVLKDWFSGSSSATTT